jgi:uncharacterized protein with PIN domain
MFFCDDTIGKLMKKIRLLGFDAMQWKGESDKERILLTKSRDRWRTYSGESFLIMSDGWKEQLEEVEKRYTLSKEMMPFTRCAECNTVLVDASPCEVKDLVPERILLSVSKFKRCPRCGKIYWNGTHVEKIKMDFEEIFHGAFF